MKVYRYLSAPVLVIFTVIAACGKSDLNYGGKPVDNTNTKDTRGELVDSAPVKETVKRGTLRLEENRFVKYGFANYAIYEDGTIAYEGVVSFLGYENGGIEQYGYKYWLSQTTSRLFAVPFRGALKVSLETLQSKTYNVVGATQKEAEVQFAVTSASKNQRTIAASFINAAEHEYSWHGSPTDHEATGTLTIDVSNTTVDVTEARITGRAFGESMTIVVHKMDAL